jgi:hypothetical protein
MKRMLSGISIAGAAAAFAISFAAISPAQAQRYTNYPVCAVYGGFANRVVSCAFNNFAQCQMSVSGRGGFCEPNPDYVPARKRGHRNQ